MNSVFSEELKNKVFTSGNQINLNIQKIKENYDRHTEKINDYFKKYFIKCENSKISYLHLTFLNFTKLKLFF